MLLIDKVQVLIFFKVYTLIFSDRQDDKHVDSLLIRPLFSLM